MSGLKTLIFGRRNRIGRRLIVRIIAFSSLITLLISIIQLAFEYRELRGELDRQLDSISIHVPNIAGNVWNFDEVQIQLALDALRQLPNIDQVSVTTAPDHKQWVRGENRSRDTVTRRYALRHQAKGELAEIGQLDVIASLSALYGQVAARALTIVISNGLKTILVVLFMVFLFRRLVTRRLENMLHKVEQLSPDMLPSREAPTLHEPLDELQAVEWTLDKSARHLGNAVAALNRVNLELEQRVAEQAALLQNALVGIVMVRHREIVTCNRRFEEIFGYDSGAMTGRSSDILYLSDDELARIGDHALGAFAHGMSFTHTLLMRKRDGSSIWVEIAGRAIDNDKPREGSIWIFTDVSEHKKAQESIEFIAYHDALTELPNRRLAQDRFHQAVAFSERVQSRIAVLCLDLDNFKTINDSLGHGIGDRLIQQVATRLIQSVRDTDTVSRQGGDEFIIVLSNIAEPDATAPILVKLMEGLLDPYDIDGHELNTTVSVGVAIYPDDGPDFDTLLKKADMAMYRAKDAGRNTYRFFDPQMNVDAVEQLRMRNGLRRALERREFVLHYQPQIDLASGALVGVEALIRWRHPELGMVPPARFIPVAEESGLIVVIGEWVLREACRQAALWHQAGLADLVIAVNLSALQFKRGDLEQSVVAALEESGIKPSLLELELTESILISNIESVLATVKRLKALGVKLSIDDFGTGYSSLSYLKRFEVDRLKIDQSFVRDLASNAEDAAIVHAIIRMAHSLGLTTIAEGVEDAAALARLRVFGCDLAQGYFFARPMPAEELMSYLDKAALALP